MPSNIYNQDFFNHIDPDSRRSAEVIVPILVDMFHPQSVVDVGCGTGMWLSVFKKFGVTRIMGFDGACIEHTSLHIDKDEFSRIDLRKPVPLKDRYDLALCLEVAEHLSPPYARGLVNSLSNLSDIVFFSAAVPGQGGKNHLNEQWPSYWEEKFNRTGFLAIDAIRPLIWQNPGVAWFYRQNCFLYIHNTIIDNDEKLKHSADIHAQNDLLIVNKYVLGNNLSIRASLKRIPTLSLSALIWGFRKIFHYRW